MNLRMCLLSEIYDVIIHTYVAHKCVQGWLSTPVYLNLKRMDSIYTNDSYIKMTLVNLTNDVW